MLEVTILILPLPNQIILHMINKIFIKIPLFFCQKHWIKIFNLSSNEKIKIINKTIKYYWVILFWLVHKQNKGIKMIDAIVKLDQYKGIHAWEMI